MNILSRITEVFRGKPERPAPPPVSFVTPEVFRDINRLKQECTWLSRLLEDDITGEIGFTNGLDGTDFWGQQSQVGDFRDGSYRFAYDMCMFRPCYGAAFYINEVQHRRIRAKSRAFCSINPYSHGILHSLKTHVIGKGHNWTAGWRNPNSKGPEDMLTRVQADLDEFYAAGYREHQKESIERRSRDGEFFRRFKVQGGRLRVSFVEPLNVWTPPGSSETTNCYFGIQFDGDDYENPQGYYIRRTNYLGAQTKALEGWQRMVSADEIQHVKNNVDKGTPRGIPDTYWTQARLEQSLKTLKASGNLVQFRNKVGLIRQHVDALAGSIQPLLSQNAVTTIHTPTGRQDTLWDLPDAAVVDASNQTQYTFPSQNLEIKETIAAIQAELQSVATSMGLADYMVSGTLGAGASYSASMVAEGPVVKTFEDHQYDTIDADTLVVAKIIDVGIEYGRYPEEARELVRVEMRGPPLGRLGIQAAQEMQIESQCGITSKRTWRMLIGRDDETETANLAAEKEAEAKTEAELAKKYPQPMPTPGVNGNGKPGTNGQQNGTGPRNRMTPNARPFSADQEGRQMQRASGATVEEAFDTWFQSRLQESSHDPAGHDKPTESELAMATVWITDDFLAKIKSEILSLPRMKEPIDPATAGEYEPGVKGLRLGVVDNQTVWAVDMREMSVRHDSADTIVAGNSERWPFLPPEIIFVDWSFVAYDRNCDLLHECCEFVMMRDGKFSYSLAHKLSNYFEREWLFVLRPELKVLAEAVAATETE
jgi:hypothetical protein